MPKTEKIYTKNINVRISKEQYDNWESYAKENGFDAISKLVRHATDGLIMGVLYNSRKNNRNEILREKIDSLENENEKLSSKLEDMLKTQSEILRVLAKKVPSLPEDVPYKQIIINLLQEKPRDEEELKKILDPLTEIEILNYINELLKTSIIIQEKEKYKVV